MASKNDFRILILDDDPEVVSVTYEFLQTRQYTNVTFSENFQDTDDFLRVNAFDLIILDLHIQRLTGVEFLEKIRRGDFGPVNMVAGVFINSGWISMKVEQACLALGANAIFAKPTDFPALLGCVDDLYREYALRVG